MNDKNSFWYRSYPILLYYVLFVVPFILLFGVKTGILINIPFAFLLGMINQIIRGLDSINNKEK